MSLKVSSIHPQTNFFHFEVNTGILSERKVARLQHRGSMISCTALPKAAKPVLVKQLICQPCLMINVKFHFAYSAFANSCPLQTDTSCNRQRRIVSVVIYWNRLKASSGPQCSRIVNGFKSLLHACVISRRPRLDRSPMLPMALLATNS